MDHVAIMRKSWGLTQKILTGQKTIESRWYMNRGAPWGRIAPGETVYFKDSGEPVTVKAEVTAVLQFENLTAEKAGEILKKHAGKDLGTEEIMPDVIRYVTGKKYCILVFLKNPQKVEPFRIDKTGFGAMSAWLCVDDIERIRTRGDSNARPLA